jgi:uncharacterized membrane protein
MADQVTKSVIVDASPEHLYGLWQNFETFPNFMSNIKLVEYTGEKTTHWEMEGPLDTTLEWEAETTVEQENKRIAWSTKDREGDVTTSGQVTFNSLPNEQTEITATVHYEPQKAGLAGEVVEALFANPDDKLEQDLRNFKQYAERHVRRLET